MKLIIAMLAINGMWVYWGVGGHTAKMSLQESIIAGMYLISSSILFAAEILRQKD